MNIQIRLAEVEDAPVVALLGRLTFSETFGYLFEHHPEDLAKYLIATFSVAKIRRSLGQPNNHYWLAFADDLPVGYAKLKNPWEAPKLSTLRAAQIQKIYILRDYLAQGIGLPLLQAACGLAADLNVETIWLTVLNENERAIRFYKRHGFTTLGQATFQIGAQTFDFEVLRKDLGPPADP
jgi:ribosomal protein S18 acetylase RimI-like enzyme